MNHTWSVTVLNPNGDRWAVGNGTGTWTACQPPTTVDDDATPVAPTVVQAECVGGVTTPASVTLPPNGGGITYSMSPSAPVAGNQVTVTATLSAGYVWVSPLPDGWLPGDPAATTATWSVTLESGGVFPVASGGSGGDAGDVYCW